MSLILPLAKYFLNLITSKEVRAFEESLKNPEEAQKLLLDKWAKNKTYTQSPLSHEYTSGSSGIKKKIGYTKDLKSSFSTMFQLWAWDILNNAPIKLKSGVIYMSLSPRINDHGGLEDDAEYISPLLRPIVKKFLAVDPSMQRVASGEEFYFKVATELLKNRELEIISIWSPSYFLNLLDYIRSNKDKLGFNGSFHQHWPNLKMISAWGSGESQNSANELKKIFPNVWFQSKGLMATEGPMTIPWIKANQAIPLLNHTYFEFIDKNGAKLLLHELKKDVEYEIFPRFPNMETPYQIGDIVRCTGFYHKTPTLEFVGRKGDSSDLVGEKLSGKILRELLLDIAPYFIFIPKTHNQEYLYEIIIDSEDKKIQIDEFEKRLLTIHHYKLARELGQLKMPKLVHAPGLKKEMARIQLSLGIREGDQKDLTIIKRIEIQEALYLWVLSISSSV